MTNNATIDGVSRKTIERIADHCKFWKDHAYIEAIGDIEPELRALLDAPAVERQEPVPCIRCSGVGFLPSTRNCDRCHGSGSEPVDVATLQSTIAQLQERVSELETDKARLDFWQENPQYAGGFAPSGEWSFFSRELKTCYGKDLRGAMDRLQEMHACLDATAALNEKPKQ